MKFQQMVGVVICRMQKMALSIGSRDVDLVIQRSHINRVVIPDDHEAFVSCNL